MPGRQKYTEEPDGMLRMGNGHRMSKEAYENRLRYVRDYSKKKYAQFCLKVHKVNNKDIVDHLRKQKNVTAYLMELIRKDMDNC